MFPSAPDRNLALDLVRATEAAALIAARRMGLGDDPEVERSAAEAMRTMLRSVHMDGTVVIGQATRAGQPALHRGDRVGSGIAPEMDVAADPIEGVELLWSGLGNALSVIAAADHAALFDPGPLSYMDKIAVGPAAAGAVDIDAPVERNLRAIARANRKDLDDLTVVVLDRPRHERLIAEIRATGARIRLVSHGDVAGAIMAAADETGIDALLGVGGAVEGVISACALLCLGGAIHARLVPRDDTEREAARALAIDLDRPLSTTDLVRGDDVFFAATGITSGDLLRGVQYHGNGARTFSLTMRSRSGTVRAVESRHRWDKLMRISDVAYDART